LAVFSQIIKKIQRSTRRDVAQQRRSVTVEVPSALGRGELPALFERTCELLARGAGCELLLCDVAGVAADSVAVDALARLGLAARRSGCEVRLSGASPELLGLVALVGLGDVLRAEASPGLLTRNSSLPAALRGD
jgi:ABC-type transporter Mla MlaB component